MEFKIVVNDDKVEIGYLTDEEFIENREEIQVCDFETKGKTKEEICEIIKLELVNLLKGDC